MQNNQIKIPHDSIVQLFQTHLDLESNDRVLFSAPFGTGKTTFLKEFFASKSDIYKVVHLFPVNYAVASNEDVFELIKFDIFYELITNSPDDIKLKDEQFSMLLTAQSFVLNNINLTDLLKTLIKTTSKIGKSAVEIVEALDQVIKDYQDNHSNLQINELEQIKTYLETKTLKPNTILEFDEYSQLIEELLQRSKEENKDLNKKETVLIIDDIDRIDPEHIFRLFNVFSAHYDLRLKRNKFGFDKIIFVCDISNIRKMFQHRYGQGVDFSGYINKFYSTQEFEFDNRKYITDKIESIMKSIEILPTNLERIYNLKEKNAFNATIEYFLSSLINTRNLNLRSLLSNTRINIPEYKFNVESSHENYVSSAWEFLVFIDSLKQIVGDLDSLEIKLKYLSDNIDPINLIGFNRKRDLKFMTEYCIPFLQDDCFSAEVDKNLLRNYNFPEQQIKIFYKLDYDGDWRNYKPYVTEIKDSYSAKIDINIFKLYYKTFLACRTRRIIR